MSKANIPFDMKISFSLWEGGKELREYFLTFLDPDSLIPLLKRLSTT